VLAACAPWPARAPRSAAFDLGLYQQVDGAIALHDDGLMVEPYFATKALLAARQAGLDVDVAGGRWVAWAMQHQRPDGTFDRWCRDSSGSGWCACGEADADDALLALWVELLHRLAPGRTLPARWPASARLAESRLATLRDSASGLYHVSPTNAVALFMDNVEIYGALRGVAAMERRLGANARAATRQALADSLAGAIDREFWRAAPGEYTVSTQAAATGTAFYPYQVAQIYPWLDSLPPPAAGTRPPWARWMGRHGEEWLAASGDEYPWGLVALAAIEAGDETSARRWLRGASAFRGGRRWNVLEEAVFQGLSARLRTEAR
jgi:hypothetical protein